MCLGMKCTLPKEGGEAKGDCLPVFLLTGNDTICGMRYLAEQIPVHAPGDDLIPPFGDVTEVEIDRPRSVKDAAEIVEVGIGTQRGIRGDSPVHFQIQLADLLASLSDCLGSYGRWVALGEDHGLPVRPVAKPVVPAQCVKNLEISPVEPDHIDSQEIMCGGDVEVQRSDPAL